jgi:hypothetical protein
MEGLKNNLLPEIPDNGKKKIYSGGVGPDGREIRLNRDEYFSREAEGNVDTVAEFLVGSINSGGKFSEKIPLNPDGSINIESTQEIPRSALVSYATSMDTSSVNGIYKLAQSISQIRPEIVFSFKSDPGKKWVEYTASKKSEGKEGVKVGDIVMWESQGGDMWEEPKQISSFDSKDGKTFAFFEGSYTGVPVEQLKRV